MSVWLLKQGQKYYVGHPHELPGRSTERTEDLYLSVKKSWDFVCKCGQVKEEWRLIRSWFCSVEHNYVSKSLFFQVKVCYHSSTASVSFIFGINSRMFWHRIWHKKQRWSSSSVNTPEADSALRAAKIYSPFQHKARSVEQLIIHYISVIKYKP